MATTDTKVSQLIINKLTQAQYDGITTPSSTELYFVDDGKTYVTTDMLAQVATTGSYTDLSNKPTNVSSFNNDAGYLTSIPTASANTLGGIKVGTGLSIDNDGVLSATGLTSVDWSDITNKPSFATVATSGSYNDLLNKPTIPTVNDATLTIQKNGTSVGTFTANASSNATIDISVPTKTSDLNNDSGFIDKSVNDLTNYTLTSGLATVATTGSYTDLTNKPLIPAAQIQSDWTQSDNTKLDYIKNKPTLATVATSGSYNDLSNKPTIPAAQVNSDWDAVSGVAQILNKPTLATVATSGSYNDLSNKPTIPAAQVNSDWNASSGVAQILNKPSLATVATTGAYSDLSGTPTIPTVNDATLTITQNGTSAGTFTANASSNATIALTDTTYSAFTGTDGASAGAAGLVPAPATTDAGKFLKADGTWATVQSSGITYYTLSSHNIGALNLEDTTMTMDTSTTLVDIRAAIANNVLVVLPIISGDPQSWTENCILSSYESVSQTLKYRFSLQYHGYAYRMVVEIKKGTNNVSFVKVAPTPTFTTNEWNALWA